MYDVLNTAMLNRISSKEILLIAEDEIEYISYITKRVSKILTDDGDNNSRTIIVEIIVEQLDFQNKFQLKLE